MFDELLKLYCMGFVAGTPFILLLLTSLVLLNKKQQFIIYEKRKSILVFELFLLVLGTFTVFWFGLGALAGA